MSVETFSPNQVEISMTEKARKHFSRQLAENSAGAVRLHVKESGCSGFMYELDFVNSREENDKEYQFDAITLYVSAQALPYLSGTVIDYVTEGVNSMVQFSNPNAKAMCGCGESFII